MHSISPFSREETIFIKLKANFLSMDEAQTSSVETPIPHVGHRHLRVLCIKKKSKCCMCSTNVTCYERFASDQPCLCVRACVSMHTQPCLRALVCIHTLRIGGEYAYTHCAYWKRVCIHTLRIGGEKQRGPFSLPLKVVLKVTAVWGGGQGWVGQG